MNCLLQFLAITLIGWGVLIRREDQQSAAARSLLALALVLAVLILVQLIPLPPAFWTALPGRRVTANGYRLLGAPLPWLPISLAPQASIASALWLLPAFATLLALTRGGAFDPLWIAGVIVGGAVVSVVLGTLQVLGGGGSPLYFYKFTNWGQAVGFFANGNHMATLLVTAIPFGAAIQAHWLSKARSTREAPVILVITWALLIVVGIGLAINTSIAGLGLGFTVAVASALLLRTSARPRLAFGVALTGLLIVSALATIILGPIQGKLTGSQNSEDLEQLTRRVSISKTLNSAGHFLPVGSGVGTFRQIYQQTEDPKQTIGTFMNHAHSDLAEIVLETGGVGILLMALLLAWWSNRAIAIWRSGSVDYFARAAAIASGAIIVHSCVDYPLRTAAISTVFAACLSLMSGVRPFTPAASLANRGRHMQVS